jgi:prepilin-type N-terminal cleavage/methylation domain-containing protein
MKTPPILLKLLHNSAAKASPKFNKTASKKGDGGFTLLEVLIIVLILGIFASIAAPSWLAFINRQRVRTVNDRVFQSLRLAQSEAKRTKRDITVTFKYDPNATPVVDPPTVMFTPPLATSGNMQKLANGDMVQRLDDGGQIKPGTIALLTNATAAGDPDLPLNSIVFDYQGNVKKLPPSTNPASPRQFVVLVSTVKGAAKQCAIVETLIGGMRTAEGNDCPTLP